MSAAARWGERDTLKLIALYKKYRFLWDYESDLYKNANARKKAFIAILNQLDIPGMTTADVRSKIKNLRTSYYQEKRKLAIAKANNKLTKPLRWFSAFKSVMNSIYNRKVGDSVSDESEASEDETESVVPSEALLQSESFLEEIPSNDTDTYVVSIKQEFLDEMENVGDIKSITPTICDYLEPVAPKRARYIEPKIVPPRIVEAPRNIQRQRNIERRGNIERQGNTEPQRNIEAKSHKKVDEFQMFANNIAHQLRKLPLSRALNLQIEVQTLIAKERIEILKKQDENNQDEDSS